jgi:hypothetical protein
MKEGLEGWREGKKGRKEGRSRENDQGTIHEGRKGDTGRKEGR